MLTNTEDNNKQTSHCYTWRGINKNGQKLSGELWGINELAIKIQLQEKNIIIKKVSKKSLGNITIKQNKKLNNNDITRLTREIATMLNANLPLVQTLQILATGHHKLEMKQLLNHIIEQLNIGMPLSECLREHHQYFDDLYCELVHSGEYSGKLAKVFQDIATYKEKTSLQKRKIKKALAYPITVVGIAIVVTAILLIFVVPVFEDIFSSYGANLPIYTQLVVSISRWFQAYSLMILLLSSLLLLLTKKAYRKKQSVREFLDNILLKIPLLKDIATKIILERFTRTLATTFSSGVSLPYSLKFIATISGNSKFLYAILSIRSDVISGIHMSEAMRNFNIFPEMCIQMIAIGEETGNLHEMLMNIATVYEQEIDLTIESLTSLLEPAIMIILTIVIGSLVISMYLPIFQIGNII